MATQSISDAVKSGGCHVRGFFEYNALTVEHTNVGGAPLFVEYVHIRGGSSRVAVGDSVSEGQVIAEVGDAGFCPTPHLHIEAHRQLGRTSPSVPLAFRPGHGDGGSPAVAADNHAVTPLAGEWYEASSGRTDPPAHVAEGFEGAATSAWTASTAKEDEVKANRGRDRHGHGHGHGHGRVQVEADDAIAAEPEEAVSAMYLY